MNGGSLTTMREKIGQMELKAKKKRGASGSSLISMGYIIMRFQCKPATYLDKASIS